MLKGIPAFPVRCKVRLSPMTRKPARLKTFMPNTISLVSTVPPLAGINCGMRCSGHLPEPRRPELRAGLDPTALSRVAPLKVNRNPVVRKVASNPLGAVWARPSLSDVSEIKLVFRILPYRPTSNFALSCKRGGFKRRSGQRRVPCPSSLGSTARRQGRWPSPPPW